MKIVPVLIPIFALALAACGPEPRPADASGVARRDPPPPVAVLVAVPVLPHSRVVSATGTSEAVSTTLSAPYPPDSSAAWYRRALLARGWRLVGDLRAADGTLTIHAEREGPPLWIIVRKAPGGSELQVIGAVVDTSPPPVPNPARPAH